jgi:acetyl esterase/lipase
MKKILKWFGVLLAISLCGLTIYGFTWVRQYQQLANEEPEITLSTNIADITYCTMDGVPLKMDLYYPQSDGPWQVLLYVHGGSFTSGDKRTGEAFISETFRCRRICYARHC